MQKIIKYFFIGTIVTASVGCEQLIEIDPPINEIVGQEIYKSNSTAATVVAGIYASLSDSWPFSGAHSINVAAGLSADELVTVAEPTNILNVLYTNSLTNQDNAFWLIGYDFIYRINGAIEGLEASTGVTAPVKTQFVAELKFLRAYLYFYLVNLYGDVPLLTTTDLKVNSVAPRTASAEVYQHIVKDLTEAETALNGQYMGGDGITASTDRLRPNKTVARAFLARVYLYTKEWKKAEEAASTVIADNATYGLEALSDVFLTSSREAIWQMQCVTVLQRNPADAKLFVLEAGVNNNPPPGPDPIERPVYLRPQLLNDFESGDNRKTAWTGSVTADGINYPYAYKYKAYQFGDIRTEHLMIFRLAEQYLIRAEARARQNKLAGPNSAAADLNAVRMRAGLGETAADSQTALLDAILRERRVELFTEWAHRWLDLKRTGKIDEVMRAVAPTKGANVTWEPYKALYPIPAIDIQRNPSLRGHQNPGYSAN